MVIAGMQFWQAQAVWVAHASRVLAKPSRVRGLFEDRFGATPKPTRETRALPGKSAGTSVTRGSLLEKEMPDRASLAIRHLVDVSNQTKTELCVTVVSLSLDFFRCRGLNGMFADFSADLAVDLCQSK